MAGARIVLWDEREFRQRSAFPFAIAPGRPDFLWQRKGLSSQGAKLSRFKTRLDQQRKRLPQENSDERTRQNSQRSLCAGR
jgi:hypothetical protein